MSAHRISTRLRLGAAATAAAALAVGGLASVNPAGASTAGAAAFRPSARVANDTLIVTGSARSDRIALRLAPGNPNAMEVDLNDDGRPERSFDRATFSRIRVVLGSGNDHYRFDPVNGNVTDEPARIDGGSGNDTLDGSASVELFVGASGRDAVDGNAGADTGEMGSGNDSFRWDPGDGSDIVEGRSGNDTLDFNGAAGNENMRLFPNLGRAIFFRDAGNITMDTDGVERLDLTALGGNDTVTVEDMTFTDMRRADVDLSGPNGGPDGVADVVTVNGTNGRDRVDVETDGTRVDVEGLRPRTRITGSELIDQLRVNTLDGNDDVDVDAGVEALIAVAVDLGPGQR
jgi:Ca2+-binding RTX toxin-like protein